MCKTKDNVLVYLHLNLLRSTYHCLRNKRVIRKERISASLATNRKQVTKWPHIDVAPKHDIKWSPQKNLCFVLKRIQTFRHSGGATPQNFHVQTRCYCSRCMYSFKLCGRKKLYTRRKEEKYIVWFSTNNRQRCPWCTVSCYQSYILDINLRRYLCFNKTSEIWSFVQVLIVITDGGSADSVRQAAKDLHNDGVYVFAVGKRQLR